jgi:hypothetical protein
MANSTSEDLWTGFVEKSDVSLQMMTHLNETKTLMGSSSWNVGTGVGRRIVFQLGPFPRPVDNRDMNLNL